MDLKQMICPSCTGAIQVPTDMDRITCAYCGSELIVEYSEGDMNLSLVQKIKETLQDLGQETQGAIRESAGVTQTELQRVQIGQQIGTLQIQVSNIRAEIRTLEREKQLSRAAKNQLKELRKEEQECLLQIRNLQSFLPNTKGTYQVSKPKSKLLAILLAFFLGSFGIHKFYLNDSKWGIIYLVFCWTGIPTMLGLFEAVYYLLMSEETFQQKYAK
jgi:TM2 domain-containing membrane protein YozV